MAELGIEETLDQEARLRKLCRAIPEEYYNYVRIVVLEDQSLLRVKGCSGGANFKRYVKRLGAGLDSLDCFSMKDTKRAYRYASGM